MTKEKFAKNLVASIAGSDEQNKAAILNNIRTSSSFY